MPPKTVNIESDALSEQAIISSNINWHMTVKWLASAVQSSRNYVRESLVLKFIKLKFISMESTSVQTFNKESQSWKNSNLIVMQTD